MNTHLVNTAADVIHRAQQNGTVTAAGFAIALDSAQLLQSPETVARVRADALEEGATAVEEMQHTRDDAVNDLLGELDDRTAVEHITAHKAATLLRNLAAEGGTPAVPPMASTGACFQVTRDGWGDHLLLHIATSDRDGRGWRYTLRGRRSAGMGDVLAEQAVSEQDASSLLMFLDAAFPEAASDHLRSDAPAAAPGVLSQVAEDLTGARLALWEEEQTSERLRLALESAKRGRRDARARIVELERRLEAVCVRHELAQTIVTAWESGVVTAEQVATGVKGALAGLPLVADAQHAHNTALGPNTKAGGGSR